MLYAALLFDNFSVFINSVFKLQKNNRTSYNMQFFLVSLCLFVSHFKLNSFEVDVDKSQRYSIEIILPEKS